MPHHEHRSVFSLGAIMAFRLLGLFMILPVFSVAATGLTGSTPTLIGLAIGIYGATQACLQLPFGFWSDRIGRKPVITIGLICFIAGSIIAAMSHSIYGVIVGRALQGAGAIGSTVLAFVADLTRDESRNKAMAMVGMTIGMSFALSIVVGPMVNHYFGLSGIFWLTAILGTLAIVMLYTMVPTAPTVFADANIEPMHKQFKSICKNTALLRFDAGILLQHAILTALFLALPRLLHHSLNLNGSTQTWMYLAVLVAAFIAMVPFIIIAEKKRRMKGIFIGAIAVILASQVMLYCAPDSVLYIGVVLFLFFTAFTLQESMLPSLVSKTAPITQKGGAMGIYSSCQFFGIFLGGVIGGYLLQHAGVTSLFVFGGIMSVLWLFIAIPMPQPPYISTLTLVPTQSANVVANTLVPQLKTMEGVADIAWMAGERLLIVKIDKQVVTEEAIKALLT